MRRFAVNLYPPVGPPPQIKIADLSNENLKLRRVIAHMGPMFYDPCSGNGHGNGHGHGSGGRRSGSGGGGLDTHAPMSAEL